ncbi:MAG TPA: ATP-binding cassette domain-containing protein, partial [Candidatus Dormibacteraeota bacterium]|nr:ATP-binding cassette domain-containing protein [Candidatus Dormibacteraeota bacterium]
LASALAMRPRLVVLDEPTSQLDPEGAAMVLAAVMALVGQGRHAIVSEHRLEQLVHAASGLVLVTSGSVDKEEPGTWRPPAATARPPRPGALGGEAWSLKAVSAGFGGRVVLEGIDLAGMAGEVVALSGPNGGGKTTLLRLISGALSPLAGTVEHRPGRVAYLPQNPTTLLHLPTVTDEVKLTLERAGETESPDGILGDLGLLPVAGRYPRDLSSGERQRAALATVLPGRPTLVLLDEPTRGMDWAARQALVGLVARLRDRGAAIVLATHDTELRAALADRVIRVGEGKVLETSPEVVRA